MSDEEVTIKLTQLDGKVSRVIEHHDGFKELFADIQMQLLDNRLSNKTILAKIEGIPEKVRTMELDKAREDGYMNNVVKPFFLVFIGMVVSFVFNNIIFAPREEKFKPRMEIRK